MIGYIHRKWDDGVRENEDLFMEFHPWVMARLGFGISKRWADAIYFAAGSEQSAYEMTLELWKEYKDEVESKAADSQLVDEPIQTRLNGEG